MKYFLSILFGCLLALTTIEVGLRAYWYPGRPPRRYDTASPAESVRWVSHPLIPYSGRSNAKFELKNQDGGQETIETNSYGFRSHEFPGKNESGEFRILCLGGSTTYGFKTPSNSDTWPETLEYQLDSENFGIPLRIFNLGTDMATTAVSVSNLLSVGVHLEPDLIIVYHGYNDFAAIGAVNHRPDHSHFYQDLPSIVWRGFQAALPLTFKSSYALTMATGTLDHRWQVNDLSQAVSKARLPDANRFRGMENTLDNLRTVADLAAGIGAKALFSTFQFTYADDPAHVMFNTRLRNFFRTNNLHYVDQAALIPDYDPTINVDPCHFTPEGRRMMAKNFFDYIVEQRLIND